MNLALQDDYAEFLESADKASQIDMLIFIKNADKLLTNGEGLTNNEARAYANKIKSLREES